MITTETCIRVYSEMNPWIDFCIIIYKEDFALIAKSIINKAYNDWFDADHNETLSDFISSRLTEYGINHDIYFAPENEDET